MRNLTDSRAEPRELPPKSPSVIVKQAVHSKVPENFSRWPEPMRRRYLRTLLESDR